MKRDIQHLVRTLFRDQQLLESIGFTPTESQVLFKIIQGRTVAQAAQQVGLSINKVRYIKQKKLPLVPLFLQRKLQQIGQFDLRQVQEKLLELHQVIVEYLDAFQQTNVYEISELQLSRRTINSLSAFNIKNTLDLCAHSSTELKTIKNIGDKAIQEIETELERLHLRLKLDAVEE